MTSVEHERESGVALGAALVKLVEDHEAVPVERGVLLHHARQHALGDDLDARGTADLCVEPGAVANGATDGLATEMRHAMRRSPRGEASRLEHDDAIPA